MAKQTEAQKRWRKENKERIARVDGEWRKQNQDKVFKYTSDWYDRNPKQKKKYDARYRKTHAKSITEQSSKAWFDVPKTKRQLKTRKEKLKVYGLTVELYNQMVIAQSNKCAICNKDMNKPNIDHNHATGKVRALLCHGCNKGIGLLYEDPIILQQAIKYLEKYNG